MWTWKVGGLGRGDWAEFSAGGDLGVSVCGGCEGSWLCKPATNNPHAADEEGDSVISSDSDSSGDDMDIPSSSKSGCACCG